MKYNLLFTFQGLGNISHYAISFHYISPERMYEFEYFIYYQRAYGIDTCHEEEEEELLQESMVTHKPGKKKTTQSRRASRTTPTIAPVSWAMLFHRMKLNGETAVLQVHYVALIGNHGIVRIIYCSWRRVALVTLRPLSMLLSMTYHWYCLWRFNFKGVWEKTDCTDLWVMKPTNQVSPSSGFRDPHCLISFAVRGLSLLISIGEAAMVWKIGRFYKSSSLPDTHDIRVHQVTVISFFVLTEPLNVWWYVL